MNTMTPTKIEKIIIIIKKKAHTHTCTDIGLMKSTKEFQTSYEDSLRNYGDMFYLVVLKSCERNVKSRDNKFPCVCFEKFSQNIFYFLSNQVSIKIL